MGGLIFYCENCWNCRRSKCDAEYLRAEIKGSLFVYFLCILRDLFGMTWKTEGSPLWKQYLISKILFLWLSPMLRRFTRLYAIVIGWAFHKCHSLIKFVVNNSTRPALFENEIEKRLLFWFYFWKFLKILQIPRGCQNEKNLPPKQKKNSAVPVCW